MADFPTAVAAFPEVAAGDPAEVLLRVADRLCAEVGCNDHGEEVPGASSPFSGNRMLGPEDELLVTQVRRRLAQIATALEPQRARDRAVAAALDGSEMVMRGELTRGNRDWLPALIPSFILLIALPAVDHDEALALSRRTSELVEAEGGG